MICHIDGTSELSQQVQRYQNMFKEGRYDRISVPYPPIFERDKFVSFCSALCITLIQAGESGQAVELFQDMGEQLKDLELTALRHQKSALDRSITFYQLGMLGATLGVILYACVGYMFRAAVKF